MMTNEDLDILTAQLTLTSAPTCLSMLMGDGDDARIMRDREWDRYWAAIQQYELDYVY